MKIVQDRATPPETGQSSYWGWSTVRDLLEGAWSATLKLEVRFGHQTLNLPPQEATKLEESKNLVPVDLCW